MFQAPRKFGRYGLGIFAMNSLSNTGVEQTVTDLSAGSKNLTRNGKMMQNDLTFRSGSLF